MSQKAIYTHLHELKCNNIVNTSDEKKSVVTLTTSDTIEQAIIALSKNKILSCPVKDADGDFLGFVDNVDIISHVARAAPSQWELKRDELQALEIAGRAFSLVKLDQVVDFDGKDPFVKVFEDSPASMLVDLFSKGIHRALLFNREQEICGIVSQSDVARHLATNMVRGEMKHIGAKSLHELGYATNNVQIESIASTSTVLDAVKRMVEKKVSALAVVDSGSGRLVGNFSASDIRGLYREKFPHLLDSLADFLQERSPKSLNPVCGRPESSFLDIVKELTQSKLHHLWVVDDDFKPTGIISLTDVMTVAKTATV